MYKNGVSHIAKYHLISIFNSRFFNREYYAKNKSNLMLLDYEDNRVIQGFISDEVLDFCINTEICKLLNVSYIDLMHKVDYATFKQIKQKIIADNERKARVVEETKRNLDKSLKNP